ncbi:MAG: type II toxin-antitoxin system VapC family toxin [Dehalococcoidia bacterium]
MTTRGDEPIFLDTNVLIYASEERAPLHQVARQAIRSIDQTGVMLWLSRQILREYLAVLTRPQLWGNPQPIGRLIAEVRQFEAQFHIAEDGPDVAERFLGLLAQFRAGGKQVHDANIVATMQAHGIPRLLTHNEDDFARYAAVITVVPLSSFR